MYRLTHMSKFNYVKIAEVFLTVFRQLKEQKVEDTTQAKLVLREMMKMLEADNPKFSRELFIDYIKLGLEGGGGNGQRPGVPAAKAPRRAVGDGPERLL